MPGGPVANEAAGVMGCYAVAAGAVAHVAANNPVRGTCRHVPGNEAPRPQVARRHRGRSDQCMQHLKAHARFNKDSPDDLAAKLVQQYGDESPER